VLPTDGQVMQRNEGRWDFSLQESEDGYVLARFNQVCQQLLSEMATLSSFITVMCHSQQAGIWAGVMP
jgi:hypothetical protein